MTYSTALVPIHMYVHGLYNNAHTIPQYLCSFIHVGCPTSIHCMTHAYTTYVHLHYNYIYCTFMGPDDCVVTNTTAIVLTYNTTA